MQSYSAMNMPRLVIAILATTLTGPSLLPAESAVLDLVWVRPQVTMNTGERSLTFRLKFAAPWDDRVRAARVIIESARDDTGAHLGQTATPAFRHDAVGCIAGDSSRTTSKEPLEFALHGSAKTATFLPAVKGTVEAVVPDLDPGATATVERITSYLGVALDSAAFARAGVTVTVFSQPENELLVQIIDPEDLVVGWEFEAHDGGALPYNHNGVSHASGNSGTSSHRYHFATKPPDDARFTCWMRTKKSLVRFPLNLTNILLPPTR